jgi:hypothetical protein
MTQPKYDRAQLEDLVLQMMETELGGEKIYRAAIATAINGDLKEEWQGYLKETLHHQDVVRGLCATLGLNVDRQSPTRTVVGHIGKSLVQAIEMAQRTPCLQPRRSWPQNAWCWPRPRTTPTGSCWACRRSGHGRHRQSVESRPRRCGARRRPPPFPHQGLDARAGHSGPGHARSAATSGRSQTGGDRHWRFAGRAGALVHAVTASLLFKQ